MIGFFHVGIASLSKCPEFALDDSESLALAGATAKVMEQFDMTPDPRITAIVGLITTAGTIYVPRYYLIRQRKAKKNKNNKVEPVNTGQFIEPMTDPNNFNFGG